MSLSAIVIVLELLIGTALVIQGFRLNFRHARSQRMAGEKVQLLPTKGEPRRWGNWVLLLSGLIWFDVLRQIPGWPLNWWQDFIGIAVLIFLLILSPMIVARFSV
jgi:hypothetical protein